MSSPFGPLGPLRFPILAWLDAHTGDVDRDLREELGPHDRRDYRADLVLRAKGLLESFPARERTAIAESLRLSTRRALARANG